MPDNHRRAIPQVTAVDELFGTHNCDFLAQDKDLDVFGRGATGE
jgi:hypothetical protein